MTNKNDKQLDDLQVRIKGKLQEVDRYDGKKGPIFENLIIIPSKDEFSSPLRIAVKSVVQIAQIDQIVDVIADVKSRFWRREKDGKTNYSPELWLSDEQAA